MREAHHAGRQAAAQVVDAARGPAPPKPTRLGRCWPRCRRTRPFSSTCATRRATLSPSMMGSIGVVGLGAEDETAQRVGRFLAADTLSGLVFSPGQPLPGDVDGPGRGERVAGPARRPAARRAAGRRAGPATPPRPAGPSTSRSSGSMREAHHAGRHTGVGFDVHGGQHLLPTRLGRCWPLLPPDAAIFVHLRDAAGNIVAQHDGFHRSGWPGS